MKIYVTLAVLVIAFASGWTVRGWQVDAAHTLALEKAQREVTRLRSAFINLQLEAATDAPTHTDALPVRRTLRLRAIDN